MKLKIKDLFGLCFLKSFLKIVFEIRDNTILVFSEDCSYFLNLIFFLLSVFLKNKKNDGKSNVSFVFSLFSCYLEQKPLLKNCKQTCPTKWIHH